MRKDFSMTENGKEIINNDFNIEFSDQQHIQTLLEIYPGEIKSNPIVGVGLIQKLKTSAHPLKIKRQCQMMLNYDGYNNANIHIENNDLNTLKITIE